jgi:uncharacterized surface protein with fasciclin (FAS1) repeats
MQAFTAAAATMGRSLDSLMADTVQLKSILNYHIIPGALYARPEDLAAAGTVKTQLGKSLTVDTRWGSGGAQQRL